MILHDTRSAAKFFAGSIIHKIQKMAAAGTNLLALPFREEGFKPLYPVLRSKTLTGLVISAAAMSEAWAAYGTGVDASSGLGYVQWIIMAIGLIFTLIMGISCGFAFKQDAANAKAQHPCSTARSKNCRNGAARFPFASPFLPSRFGKLPEAIKMKREKDKCFRISNGSSISGTIRSRELRITKRFISVLRWIKQSAGSSMSMDLPSPFCSEMNVS